jgi:2-amino-4-hydroxy-6-hydroxymethyldihydropteridine diphosphokinase
MPPKVATAFVALGSNLPYAGVPPWQVLARALQALAQQPQLQVVGVSCCYQSPPWGVNEAEVQPPYYNAVAQLATVLPPLVLLHTLQKLEVALGRVRQKERRYAARTLDLDLLWMDAPPVNTPALVLPHPHWAHRPFVLWPWAQLAPQLVLEGEPLWWWVATKGQSSPLQWHSTLPWAAPAPCKGLF